MHSSILVELKKIVLLTFFSVFLLSAMFIPAGFAAIGVKEDDWIEYDYTISGEFPELPYPTWMKVEFLSVSGTTVTILMTDHMSDGTESNQTLSGDVATSSGDISGVVIPANSKVGDSINIGYYGTITIDDESTRTYAGASRTVVYASFSEYESHYTFYWDKQTGVAVEVSVTSEDMTGTVKATETNMWQAVPFWMQWWLWAIVAVVIVTLAGAVYFLKKRKPPTPTVPTLPTEGTLEDTQNTNPITI